MATQIHPTAVVSPRAESGNGVEIGPSSVVGAAVKIGDRTRIGPHVVIDGETRIGCDNVIVGQANLGGPPQDLSYRGEPTQLEIGDRNTIREFVTVNRGTIKGGGITRVASDCLLMACCHVAHDCQLEDRVILANCALLAGHVYVGKGASISGGSVGHHFITIGRFAYVGGMSRMAQDVPPFVMFEGHPGRVRGVNVVGLRRAGFSEAEIEGVVGAYRLIYRSGAPRLRTLEELKRDPGSSPLVLELVEALEQTNLGLKGRYRESLRADFARAGAERILGAAHA
jgi:UDP-N-acetylglucosamine acyltransferase